MKQVQRADVNTELNTTALASAAERLTRHEAALISSMRKKVAVLQALDRELAGRVQRFSDSFSSKVPVVPRAELGNDAAWLSERERKLALTCFVGKVYQQVMHMLSAELCCSFAHAKFHLAREDKKNLLLQVKALERDYTAEAMKSLPQDARTLVVRSLLQATLTLSGMSHTTVTDWERNPRYGEMIQSPYSGDWDRDERKGDWVEKELSTGRRTEKCSTGRMAHIIAKDILEKVDARKNLWNLHKFIPDPAKCIKLYREGIPSFVRAEIQSARHGSARQNWKSWMDLDPVDENAAAAELRAALPLEAFKKLVDFRRNCRLIPR